MGTPYPTDEETSAIARHAQSGDVAAGQYLALLNACESVLELSNGISVARGIKKDAYEQAIDGALAELMPNIYGCVESSGGLEGLKWYIPQLSPQEEESDEEPDRS